MNLFRSRATTLVDKEAEKIDNGPVTSKPLLSPPSAYSPIQNPPLTEAQLETQKNLRTYMTSIMLTSDHEYYESEKGFLTDQTLSRYLRARKWDFEAAKTMLENTVRWRRDYRPEQLDPDYISPEADTGKMYFNGFDKCGRPIWIMRPRNQNSKDEERQIKHIVFCLERGIRLMPKDVEKMSILIDFKDSASSHNPSLATSKRFLSILGNHYPERLGVAFIVKSPWFFLASFKLVSPFIDPVTKAKIQFVRDQDKTKDEQKDLANLFDFISADQLECEYGGNYNFQFDKETYWNTLLEITGKPFKTIEYL
ncbi:CRAL-TRIO domain-containing protein [Phycomyces nitens]|nr:CRAL-TRIO domain-containing protein [Phycomyces nitens]